jgi:hypothetical protein
MPENGYMLPFRAHSLFRAPAAATEEMAPVSHKNRGKGGGYFGVMARSSKYVTESALVHSPTLPALGKVLSVASILSAPS